MMSDCFLGYVQVPTGTIAETLESTELVAYLVHVVLVDFSVSFRRGLLENEHTLVGLLPIGEEGGLLDSEKIE